MKNTGPPRRSVLGACGLLLIFSFFFPYWEASSASGSQAHGPELAVYVTHATGPLREQLAAPESILRLEHSTATAASLSIFLLGLAAALAKNPWVLLLCLPAMLLPAVVCADASEFLAACGYPAELAVRTGAGAMIAWGAAALLAGGALREVLGFGAASSPDWPNRARVRE